MLSGIPSRLCLDSQIITLSENSGSIHQGVLGGVSAKAEVTARCVNWLMGCDRPACRGSHRDSGLRFCFQKGTPMRRVGLILFVATFLAVGCGGEPGQAAPQPIFVPVPVPVPVPVTYPRIIIEPDPPYCDFICIQYTANTQIFCDSDCDGWYDAIEVEFGDDPCNPFSPPFSPDPGSGAMVCPNIFGKSKKMTETEATQRFQSQQYELSNP